MAVVAPYFKDGSPSDYAAKVAKQVYDAYFAKTNSSSQTNEATVNSQIRQQQNNRR